MKARQVFFLSVLAIAILAGCGGDSTSSLDKAEFIKQASAACARERKPLVNEAAAYLEKPAVEKQPNSTALANMSKAVVVPIIEAEIAAVRQLGAPEGDEEEVEAMLAAQQAGVEEVSGLQQAKSMEEVEAHFREATKLYEAYGFEACTNGP